MDKNLEKQIILGYKKIMIPFMVIMLIIAIINVLWSYFSGIAILAAITKAYNELSLTFFLVNILITCFASFITVLIKYNGQLTVSKLFIYLLFVMISILIAFIPYFGYFINNKIWDYIMKKSKFEKAL